MPCIVAFIAFFINGTDYFIGGMLGIISGPVLYYIWKRMYGGLAVKDPVNYPLNPKTKLAMGDLRRIAFNFGFIAFFGFWDILGSSGLKETGVPSIMKRHTAQAF